MYYRSLARTAAAFSLSNRRPDPSVASAARGLRGAPGPGRPDRAAQAEIAGAAGVSRRRTQRDAASRHADGPPLGGCPEGAGAEQPPTDALRPPSRAHPAAPELIRADG